MFHVNSGNIGQQLKIQEKISDNFPRTAVYLIAGKLDFG
jgi:hypothetical protein